MIIFLPNLKYSLIDHLADNQNVDRVDSLMKLATDASLSGSLNSSPQQKPLLELESENRRKQSTVSSNLTRFESLDENESDPDSTTTANNSFRTKRKHESETLFKLITSLFETCIEIPVE